MPDGEGPRRLTADPDAALVRRLARGDRAALAVLVERHRDGLWRLLRALTPDAASAEDAMQETFLAAWRGAAGWRGEGSARAWLYGMARRQAARTWRRRAGEPADPVPLHALGEAAGWGDARSPEELAAAVQDRDRLWAALRSLSPADREVIVLRDLDGLTGPEAAEALGLPLATLKTRLHRARLRLMAALRGGDHD